MSKIGMLLKFKENAEKCLQIRGEIYLFSQNVEAPEETVVFVASKKTIIPVRELQILSHSRILLY